MEQIPDAPWIQNAERYGTAYRDAWVWGGSVEDYDNPYSGLIDEDDFEDEEEEIDE